MSDECQPGCIAISKAVKKYFFRTFYPLQVRFWPGSKNFDTKGRNRMKQLSNTLWSLSALVLNGGCGGGSSQTRVEPGEGATRSPAGKSLGPTWKRNSNWYDLRACKRPC